MKNVILVIVISFFGLNSFAQYREVQPHKDVDEDEGGGFKKDHLFTGGGINLSFSGYDFVVGGSPVFGYSFNKWFDAGVGFNFTYISEKVSYTDGTLTGDKIHQTDIAPIVFARVYPIRFLFIQVQGEENFISEKYKYADGQASDKYRYNVTSLLPGAGYCSGRQGVGDFFYYISISVDVLKNKRSPYVQYLGYGSVELLPIIRAGIQVPLFQGKK